MMKRILAASGSTGSVSSGDHQASRPICGRCHEAMPVEAHPLVTFPHGLQRLQELGRSLVTVTGEFGTGLRVVVTTPTLRFAALAACLGAGEGTDECGACKHAALQPRINVATYLDQMLTDVRLNDVRPGRLVMGKTTFTAHFDSVHRLPDGFPERAPNRMINRKRELIAAWLRCEPSIAGKLLSARCAHPVLVVGKASDFINEVTALAEWAEDPTLRVRLEAGRRLEDWFRYPVIAVRVLPGGDAPSWVAELSPRLVVVAGATAWRRIPRWHWPGVPVLVLLSRREYLCAESVSSIVTSGWAIESSLNGVAPNVLHSGDGLEIAAYREPTILAGDDVQEEW